MTGWALTKEHCAVSISREELLTLLRLAADGCCVQRGMTAYTANQITQIVERVNDDTKAADIVNALESLVVLAQDMRTSTVLFDEIVSTRPA